MSNRILAYLSSPHPRSSHAQLPSPSRTHARLCPGHHARPCQRRGPRFGQRRSTRLRLPGAVLMAVDPRGAWPSEVRRRGSRPESIAADRRSSERLPRRTRSQQPARRQLQLGHAELRGAARHRPGRHVATARSARRDLPHGGVRLLWQCRHDLHRHRARTPLLDGPAQPRGSRGAGASVARLGRGRPARGHHHRQLGRRLLPRGPVWTRSRRRVQPAHPTMGSTPGQEQAVGVGAGRRLRSHRGSQRPRCTSAGRAPRLRGTPLVHDTAWDHRLPG